METKQLKVANIRTDGGTQSRDGINSYTVAEYADEMRSGAAFPPIVVFYDGSEYWLADGFHRVHAAQATMIKEMPAEIRQGSQRDAILYSVGANHNHGLRRTNDDKRRAVSRLLNDAEWVQWSDREIAEKCNVTHPFVAKLRMGLSGNGFQIERKVSRNGTTYQQNISNIITANEARRMVDEPSPQDESIQVGEKPAGVSGVFQHPLQSPPGVVRHGVDTPLNGKKVEPAKPDPLSNRPQQVQTGPAPVDTTKLMQRIAELEQRNTNQEATLKSLLETNTALTKQLEAIKPIDITKYGLPPVLSVQYTTKYGEERLSKTLTYMVEMGMKHTDSDLAGHILELVKTGKLPVNTRAAKAKKVDKPTTPPNPNHAFVTELIATYLQFSGVIAPEMYGVPTIRGKFEQLHKLGITPDLLQAYICGLRMDRFWKDKAITWQKVMQEIQPWLNQHKPGWKPDEEAKPDFDPRSPEVPPEDPELLAKAKILNEELRQQRIAKSAMLNPFSKVSVP